MISGIAYSNISSRSVLITCTIYLGSCDFNKLTSCTWMMIPRLILSDEDYKDTGHHAVDLSYGMFSVHSSSLWGLRAHSKNGNPVFSAR